MPVGFQNAEPGFVHTEAIANRCRVVLANGQGVYFLAERGERRPRTDT